jgi:hypothetical protein
MRIDCDTCTARGDACTDCVVTVLLGAPPDDVLSDDDQAALGVLSASGLVPPLRMQPPVQVPIHAVTPPRSLRKASG